MNRNFDLNIDKILENWELEDALREIISNAIDEQKLTSTRNIQIEKKDVSGCWEIRDFGRGLRYEHFVQNENEDKVIRKGIIGKFGVGLKDALATFDRKSVRVEILSKYGDIQTVRHPKSDFSDIETLHARITPPSDPNMDGTLFRFWE